MRLRICTLLMLLLPSVHLRADDAKDIQELLKNKLSNHVVHIRNSYADDHLSYDSQGNLKGSAQQACPNETQFKVRNVEIKQNVLLLRGPRVLGGAEVQIDIELDPAQINEQAVMDILKKVFLTTADVLKKNTEAISAPVLKVRPAPDKNSAKEDAESGAANQSEAPEKIGEGVTPPVAIYSPDPEYPDEARKKKREGDVILWVVINKEGKITQVKVARCMGAGLDESAVKTVSTWKFKPALKNGQPVSVMVNIDVNFHL